MHYICTGGCKGVSDKPGVCQAPTCPKHQHELEPCDCTDNKHAGRQEPMELPSGEHTLLDSGEDK